MVIHIATSRGARSVTKHLWYRPSLCRRVRAVEIEQILERSEWPRGVYLFGDFERMTGAQRDFAASLWEQMSERPEAFVPLNHPTRHVSRFRLLRSLYDAGVNEFNVHRLEDLDEARYPLFLRYEDEHTGSLTPLLHTRTEAEDQIAQLAADGERLDHVIATEFIETRDAAGLYRKYGAFRVGGEIVPRHMFVGPHWEVKIATNTRGTLRRREEYAYLRENPHSHEVMEVFEMADLQYGRMDYSFANGRMQVWEINDNPQVTSSLARYWKGRLFRCLVSLEGLDRALARLEERLEPGPPVALRANVAPMLEAVCAR